MGCKSFDKFDGPAEADTCYVGGKAINMHAKRREKKIKGRGAVSKTVDGEAHTNGMENFWSLFKRTVKGTYIAIAPFHVCRYISEQTFRFNNRVKSDFGRFIQALSQVVGKRLTYRQLAAIDDAGFMGIE